MAVTAIGVDFNDLFTVVRQVRFGIVLMRVVAKMTRVDLTLMLTIHSSRGPGELERQQCQQENEEQFFHGLNNSIEQVREPLSDACNPTASKDWGVLSLAIDDIDDVRRNRQAFEHADVSANCVAHGDNVDRGTKGTQHNPDSLLPNFRRGTQRKSNPQHQPVRPHIED